MTTNTIDPNLVAAINLSAKYPSIKRMGVFGSHARGEQTDRSDIDIIYDYDDALIPDMLSCLDEISQRMDCKIDFVAYYLLVEDDDGLSQDFRENVLKDIVWIYEKKCEASN